jgi:hypothetical protein
VGVRQTSPRRAVALADEPLLAELRAALTCAAGLAAQWRHGCGEAQRLAEWGSNRPEHAQPERPGYVHPAGIERIFDRGGA